MIADSYNYPIFNKSTNAVLVNTCKEEVVKNIIEKYQPTSQNFEQKEVVIFSNKKTIPTKQIFALYAINKISTLANSK